MNYKGVIFLCILFLWRFSGYSQRYKLIAHRGGVVDSLCAENSREALQEAIRRGMI